MVKSITYITYIVHRAQKENFKTGIIILAVSYLLQLSSLELNLKYVKDKNKAVFGATIQITQADLN